MIRSLQEKLLLPTVHYRRLKGLRALIANLTLYYPYPNPNRDRRCSLIHHCIPPFPNLQCTVSFQTLILQSSIIVALQSRSSMVVALRAREQSGGSGELLWREYWRWLPDDGAIAIIARPSGCRCVTRASITVA
ncbi:hypothetical protein LR48_Vigan213s001300 [Vigna angularis]|uniref:Uncharacterized protein n=1 Tax=Phaseolus angularis TaxID=3914 RepID=A0A0L9T5X6_PHAAN|nr:hypothetical protein LR48_Vigan213s001300 [Vigna angularis]